MASDARPALDGYYRPHYVAQQNRLSWADVRDKILILARMVGHLASLLELFEAHGGGGTMPQEVTKDSLLQAAGLVASSKVCTAGTLCPDTGGGGGGGGFAAMLGPALEQALRGRPVRDGEKP